MQIKLDDADIYIIKKLLENANTSYKDIAKELNITRQTVAKRVKKLTKYGVLTGSHYSIDYEKIGYPIMALILANMTEFNSKSIRSALEWAHKNKISILYWGTITGSWAIMIIALFKTVGEMERFLMSAREEGIFAQTETSIIMNLYRTPESWTPYLDAQKKNKNRKR